MTDSQVKPSPIEVWLTLNAENMYVDVRAYGPDETELPTGAAPAPASLSVRGAQREITAALVDKGYTPVTRWRTETTDRDGSPLEAVRTFRHEEDPEGE